MRQGLPVPVIIDTDPGLDDAIAILLAFASPELHVLGLTTVAGNLGLPVTTRNALRLLHLVGRNDVPVAEGSSAEPRGGYSPIPDIHGADGLGGIDLPDAPREASGFSALNFLSEALLSRPEGAVQILALGPLTNVAELIETRPEIAGRIGRIIAMGGAIHEPGNTGGRAEFNLASDPDAAALVLRSGLPVTLVPLDVTRKVRADSASVRGLAAAGAPISSASSALIGAYFSGPEEPESRPLHDPCVILRAIAPELFRAETMRLSVETGDTDAGATMIDPDGGEVEVLLGVDAAQALALVTGRLERGYKEVQS